jgi:PAS domain S-box-containing protein
MPMSTIELTWGIISIIALLVSLAAVIVISMIIHSNKTRESEGKYRLLFNRVLAPIILIDEECRLVSVNQAACSLFEFSEKELSGLDVEELIPKERWPKFKNEILKCLASDMDYHGEITLIGKDGKVLQTEIEATIHNTNGSKYLLASFRDIGAHKQAEEAFKDKNAALNEVLAFLEEEKLKFKRQIADTIDQVIAPILSKLVKDDGTVSSNHLNALQDGLSGLAVEAGGMLHTYGRLTPREMEICNLLKSGATSKEVAEALDISILTVNKHRERIRKKLVLVKKDVNLSTFLRQN